ncbi:hypothetical protein [Sulfurospirillum multivorans]|uniref:Uncharacterized protein n=2 Tax=Sulfurospirillum multivorans TaxID=66821 RepID=A0AA86AP99_SULMK|nr:hypothetical protein [Sulfurospirillum multivorans]AHJ13076.1 hypothetical protein SMUL_1821 [Sulfurospirillum multivorans DSM 12446]QEH06564.1 hypothetical protein SMN_1799 [Sulfurospirillum multivorans]
MKRVVKRILSWLLMKVVASDIENATLMDSKGRFIKPFHPECKDIDLEVIAIALSRIMRFFGQTKLSVAQHCVNMARIFIFLGEIELAKQALLHEIAEAFMGDLASPLKKAFPMYKDIEERLIKKAFGCFGLSYPMAKEVHDLDKEIMIDEAVAHMPNKEHWLGFGEGLDTILLRTDVVDFEPWSSEKAKDEFMATAKLLNLIS